MQIIVKSTPLNWAKEKAGIKPNTVRELDGMDVINVVNTETGKTFVREIQDITVWRRNIIFSWKHEKK